MKCFWGFTALAIGLMCWLVGDSHTFNTDWWLPENGKLVITLIGWPYIIDGVRTLRGHTPFMRWITWQILRLVWILFLLWGLYQAYEFMSLKSLVTIGLLAGLALLYFILVEVRKSRAPQV